MKIYVVMKKEWLGDFVIGGFCELKEAKAKVIKELTDSSWDEEAAKYWEPVLSQDKIELWVNDAMQTEFYIIEVPLEGVLLTEEQHEYLCERDEKLSALEMGGVDNWEWYGESLANYFEKEEE